LDIGLVFLNHTGTVGLFQPRLFLFDLGAHPVDLDLQLSELAADKGTALVLSGIAAGALEHQLLRDRVGQQAGALRVGVAHIDLQQLRALDGAG